jgi:hypothetical protein
MFKSLFERPSDDGIDHEAEKTQLFLSLSRSVKKVKLRPCALTVWCADEWRVSCIDCTRISAKTSQLAIDKSLLKSVVF